MATTILNQLRASGGTDAIISTIEIQIDSLAQSSMICDGFRDITVVDEYGRSHLAKATGMDVSLPKKDATGSQNLRFALDNVRGDVAKTIRDAISDGKEIRLIYRSFISSDLGQPADNPLHMIARQVVIKGTTAEITAGFFDLIDTQYPRDVYTSEFAPGLKYLD